MSVSTWHSDVSAAQILCIGGDIGELIQVQCLLEGEPDFVIITNEREAEVVLATEAAFDIIIMDQDVEQLLDVDRMLGHSPDAERILIIRAAVDASIAAMIQGDCRVMRVLRMPLSAELLCDAVADALLRHRARALRASAVPRVTPMGGNQCCTSRPH